MGVALRPLPPQPKGVRTEVTIRGPNTAEGRIQWQPTEGEEGVHVLCYEASDRHGDKSPPTCLVVVVESEFVEVRFQAAYLMVTFIRGYLPSFLAPAKNALTAQESLSREDMSSLVLNLCTKMQNPKSLKCSDLVVWVIELCLSFLLY